MLDKLLLVACVAAFLICFDFATDALAQTLTSTTATWASNLSSGVQTTPLYGQPCLAGDVYGNGTTDLVCVNQNGGNLAIYILESTKGASSGFDTTTVNETISSTMVGPMESSCALDDFDGDGRDDLACFLLLGEQNENWPTESWPTAWFSTSTPFSLEVANQNLIMPIQTANDGQYGEQTAPLQNPFSSNCFVGHFMAGPGQQILCNQPAVVTGYAPNGTDPTYGPTDNWYLWRYLATYSTSGAESVSETEYNWTGPPTPEDNPTAYKEPVCPLGDLNGDVLTDFVCGAGTGASVNLSTGTGFTPTSYWATNDTSPGGSCTTGDFNGDGKTDLICYMGTTTSSPVSGIFHVYFSTGSGFQPYQTWLVPNMPPLQNPANLASYLLPANQTIGASLQPAQTTDYLNVFQSICTTADLNGDGKTDLLCYANNPNNPGQWIYALSTGSGFTVNTLNSITPPSYAYEYPAAYGKSVDTVMTSAIPFYSACLLGNFMGNGIPDILCNPDSYGQTTPVEPYYIVGIISRQ